MHNETVHAVTAWCATKEAEAALLRGQLEAQSLLSAAEDAGVEQAEEAAGLRADAEMMARARADDAQKHEARVRAYERRRGRKQSAVQRPSPSLAGESVSGRLDHQRVYHVDGAKRAQRVDPRSAR